MIIEKPQKAITVKGKKYEYLYKAEDGEIYTPTEVIHGAEPWLKVTDDNEMYMLFNGTWSKVKGCEMA